jgi:lysophospholipase L1-like esterase
MLLLAAGCGVPVRAEEAKPAWAENARRVHGRFTGRAGTFAQFGDSITVTQAFWGPLRYGRRNAPPALEAAFQQVNGYLKPECWRDWKGPEFGSEGGQTVRWADQNVAAWLKKLNPEVALVMFGTNDLHALELDEYRTKLHSVVQRCLDSGTVVILSTIPPRHGFEEKAARFAEAAREIARELKVPLTDLHAEVLKRRPDDWDGALDRFKEFSGYEVPTLIARDGVHPSFPKRYQDDYSEEGLRSSGFTLRNYLTLLAYAEVVRSLR